MGLIGRGFCLSPIPGAFTKWRRVWGIEQNLSNQVTCGTRGPLSPGRHRQVVATSKPSQPLRSRGSSLAFYLPLRKAFFLKMVNFFFLCAS